MSLVIVHLYPRELGINGDVGNVTVLQRRAAAHGIDATVVDVGRGDDLPPRADLVHIGSGPLSALESVLPDARRHAGALRSWCAEGVPFLAISAGWHLLGRSISTEDGRSLDALGIFPTRVTRTADYAVEETVLDTPGGTVAGYANHNARVDLDGGATPFGQVVRGYGNLGVAAPGAGPEGVVLGASIGSHLHGALLALNPIVADGLLSAAVRRTRPDAPFTRPGGAPGEWLDRVDEFARNARAAIIARLGADIRP